MPTKPRTTLRYAQPQPKRPKRPSAAKRLRRNPTLVWINGFIVTGLVLMGFAWWTHSAPNRALNANLRDACDASELLVGVRGSGETNDQIGGLGEIVGSVNRRFSSNMHPMQVAGSSTDYNATAVDNILTAKLYEQSYADGREQLYNMLYYWNKKCPDYHFVLAGYSQGADVLGSVIADLDPKNPVESRILGHIDAVALIADPRFNPADQAINASPSAKRTGLLTVLPSGHRGVRPAMPEQLNGKVRSWCRADDPVCNFNTSALGPCAAAVVSQVANRSACTDTLNKINNEHLQYATDGTTADIARWMADKVKNRKLSPVGTSVKTANPAPSPIAPPEITGITPAQKPDFDEQADIIAPPSPTTPVLVPTAPTGARFGVTSYDRMQSGAPQHGTFTSVAQPITAASDTITYLSTIVGNSGIAVGATTDIPLTLRLCTTRTCSTVLAEAQPTITNYSETGTDIGDVAVTPGTTYYIVWYQPAAINGLNWVTYWWAGGNTSATGDELQAAVRGYNR